MCVNNLPKVVREAERPVLEPATNRLQVRCPNNYATPQTNLENHAIVITLGCSGEVSTIISGKCELIRNKLGKKKLRQQGNPQENFGVDRMRPATFLSAYVSPAASPARSIPSER